MPPCACEGQTSRLRQCSTFLQQGLRSEAIHLADQPPNLLDLVASLDLPDPNAWMEFCQNNGMVAPPPLQLDRAAQLNEAYAQDQPMEHLLSQHRLLALSRAPVRERLDVLRKIAQADAGNANWEKDIHIFERARLKELPAEFHGAMKTHDSQKIAALQHEIAGPWHEPVPVDLTAAVSEAFARVQRAGVEAELRKLIEPLRDAYAARSLQECQALVQRWKNVMASGGVAQIAPDLTDEILPVIAFVAEQTKYEENIRRFREACRAFAQLLDRDEPDAQLEAGYARLKQFQQPIPEELTQRYATKRTGRRQSTDRAHKVRLATIAATAAAVIYRRAWCWSHWRCALRPPAAGPPRFAMPSGNIQPAAWPMPSGMSMTCKKPIPPCSKSHRWRRPWANCKPNRRNTAARQHALQDLLRGKPPKTHTQPFVAPVVANAKRQLPSRRSPRRL